MKNNKLKSAFAWVILSLCSTFSFHLYAQPCVYAYTGYYCISEGSVGLIGPANTTFVDLGNAVTVSVTPAPTDDTNETVTYYNNTSNDNTPGCPPDISVGGTPPGYGVTWTAKEGSWSTNGTGLTANFTPPSCGGGSVSFVCNYTNQYPCTNTGSSGTGCNFTVVSLNITDGSGNAISSANSNNTYIVGEPVNLTVQTCGGAFSNYQWTVDGYAVGGYDVGSGTLTADFATTNSSVSFYWVDSGSKQVVCSAVCGGVSCSTNVTLTVVKPTVTVNPITSGTSIYGNDLPQFASGSDNGITFYNSLSIPANFSGTSVWSQTISLKSITRTDSGGFIHVWTNACSPLFGDLPTPYQANLGISNFTPVDSPNVSLPSNFESVSRTTNFRMTMLFQPDGGIAVPLMEVDWYWQASVTNIAGTWTIVGQPVNGNPSVSPTTTFPQWNCASTNGGFN